MARFFDLSIPIQEKAQDPQATRIMRLDHRAGAYHIENDELFRPTSELSSQTGRRLTHNSFPDEEFLSFEQIETSVHTGCHLDAPYHYGSLCEGKPARTIDQVALEWCYGAAVVLDLRDTGPCATIGRAEVQAALQRIECSLQPNTIVLFQTGADRLLGSEAYYTQHPGVGVDALEWLLDQGVHTVGIDAFSLDPPFRTMIDAYLNTGDRRYLWPAHFYGRQREYVHLEGLANLHLLPRPYGFVFSCFPINIRGAGAGWVRAVAIFDDELPKHR